MTFDESVIDALVGVTVTVADGTPVPTLLRAVTEQLKVVLLFSPTTVMGELTLLAVMAPGLQVAINPVIALPPLLAGGANEMDALELPAVTLPMIGAPGALADTVKL